MANQIKKYIIEFVNFSDRQVKGKGVEGLIGFSKNYIKDYRDLKVEFSVGKGRSTNIPWVSFLGENQKTQNGIYPVFLYYKEYSLLILAYGVSVTIPPVKKWKIDNPKTLDSFFVEKGLELPEKYGQSFLYKVYDPKNLEEYDIDSDVNNIIDKYNLIFYKINSEMSETDKKYSFEFGLFQDIGLKISDELIKRYVSSLLTKPFVILTGLSGSGKTKLAQAFAIWMSSSKEHYAIIPVGADWTNREPLLGYPNSLNNNHYVKPDSGVLDIVLAAYNDYNSNNQELAKCKPYFLILDEMNLSHVERYLADFLSTMESGDIIKLYSGGNRSSSVSSTGEYITASHVPDKIRLPKNLFIIGTVNIDETTYMFSPKVLDRANTIEFRITESEMVSFFETNGTLNMNLLLEDSQTNKGKGAQFTTEFMQLAAGDRISLDKNLHQATFLSFFDKLQEAGAEFGYRTANEMTLLMAYLDYFGLQGNAAYDIAIMQKLLPKLHGSRSKLSKVLPALLNLCMDSSQEIIFPLSFEKLSRMQKNAHDNGFASYAEA